MDATATAPGRRLPRRSRGPPRISMDIMAWRFKERWLSDRKRRFAKMNGVKRLRKTRGFASDKSFFVYYATYSSTCRWSVRFAN